MLEYPLDEAEELLKQNMHSALSNLKSVEHDQDFLRDQITTTEVNNWGVKKRQAASKESAANAVAVMANWSVSCDSPQK